MVDPFELGDAMLGAIVMWCEEVRDQLAIFQRGGRPPARLTRADEFDREVQARGG